MKDQLEVDRIKVMCPHCGGVTDIDVKFYEDGLGLRDSWVCQATYSMGHLSCFKAFREKDLGHEEQIRILRIAQHKIKKYYQEIIQGL